MLFSLPKLLTQLPIQKPLRLSLGFQQPIQSSCLPTVTSQGKKVKEGFRGGGGRETGEVKVRGRESPRLRLSADVQGHELKPRKTQTRSVNCGPAGTRAT